MTKVKLVVGMSSHSGTALARAEQYRLITLNLISPISQQPTALVERMTSQTDIALARAEQYVASRVNELKYLISPISQRSTALVERMVPLFSSLTEPAPAAVTPKALRGDSSCSVEAECGSPMGVSSPVVPPYLPCDANPYPGSWHSEPEIVTPVVLRSKLPRVRARSLSGRVECCGVPEPYPTPVVLRRLGGAATTRQENHRRRSTQAPAWGWDSRVVG